LLTRIAGHHGLTTGVHPGYRDDDRALTQEEQASAQSASGQRRPVG
jgi:hypothetical protein